jgi:hypothetical protein
MMATVPSETIVFRAMRLTKYFSQLAALFYLSCLLLVAPLIAVSAAAAPSDSLVLLGICLALFLTPFGVWLALARRSDAVIEILPREVYVSDVRRPDNRFKVTSYEIMHGGMHWAIQLYGTRENRRVALAVQVVRERKAFLHALDDALRKHRSAGSKQKRGNSNE